MGILHQKIGMIITMKVVFFGTPLFAATLLEALLEKGINVVAIVTKPDKAHGRSHKLQQSAVKELILEKFPAIPIFQPEKVSAPEFFPTLEAFGADLFIVVAYGEIIRQHLLDMPRLGCINVHGSILPKYRGAAPIQWAIINGEKESGVTIMQMVRKMDAGDVIQEVKVPIGPDTTYGEYERQMCYAAIKPLLDVVEHYENGRIPEHTPQDPERVTFAPKIELEDCQIDWRKPANELHNLIRGVNPEPGAWCYVTVKGERKRLKIWRTAIVEGTTAPHGTLIKCDKSGVVVACGVDALSIVQLQLEGKRSMTAAEFSCGINAEQLSF
jgi:methionyl-tRNA formyltransferase